ncbi:MAG: hypothetical protein AMXMBFR47_00060 [Planctomycetota bacterium]
MRVLIVMILLLIAALAIVLPLAMVSLPPIAGPATMTETVPRGIRGTDPAPVSGPAGTSPRGESEPARRGADSAEPEAGWVEPGDAIREPNPDSSDAAQPIPAAATPILPAAPNPTASLIARQDSGLPPASGPAHPMKRTLAERRERIAQFGGTVDTENAVEAGLIWLAAHQSPGGLWNRIDYRKQCPPGTVCPGWALFRTNIELDAGVTGLCVLAFLGAGYTDRVGPHQQTVSKAIEALVRLQEPGGGFSADEANATYNDSIATLALAEFYALTDDKRLVPTLERAVRRLVLAQQPLGGWDYLPRGDTGRNDTSITAWVVQALQAAAAAGIEVPRETLVRAALHFARATEADGRVWYADAGTGVKLDDQTKDISLRYGPAMTAAGMTCMQLLGWTIDNPTAVRQRSLLLADPPSVTMMQRGDRTELHDYYYWYYGTLAAFQAGGETWERWNGALRDATLPLQNRETTADRKKKHIFGSWPAYGQGWGKWGRSGGRVYATAISVLTLEIYYRHSPLFLEDPVLLRAGDWRAFLERQDMRTHRLAIKALRSMRLEIGEPVLVDLLALKDGPTALAAAEALAEIGSPAGLAVLKREAAALVSLDKARVERTISQMSKRSVESLTGSVRMYNAKRRLATVELPNAWAGLECRAVRGDREIARLRVIQRFSGRTIVVAEMISGEDVLPADRIESLAP